MKKYTTEELNRMPFNQLLNIAKKEPLSEGAKFMNELAGNRYFYKGRPVYKYQLWGMGYTSATEILSKSIPDIKYEEK